MPLPEPVGIQKEVVALEPRGHVAVLGTAGSGKTTMAVHRAALVSNPEVPNAGPTLLLTFNKSLLRYLNHLVPDDVRARLTIENYHRFARGYLGSRGRLGRNVIVRNSTVRLGLIGDAAKSVRARDPKNQPRELSVETIAAEVAWLTRHGLDNRATYLEGAVEHQEPFLHEPECAALYDIYEEYLRIRAEAGYSYDWDDIATAVRRELEQDETPRRYKHVVLDEGQDFSPEMLRSLVLAVPPDGSVSFFGDAAQQIYGRRISWRDAGFRVTEPLLFRKNYRNTKEIADLALAIAAMPYYADEPDMVAPDEFRAAGPRPTLVRFATEADEVNFVVQQAVAAAAAGQSVGILVRRWTDATRFTSRMQDVQELNDDGAWRPGAGVSCGVYHAGKGLEFETVYLPFLTAAHIPDPAVVAADGASEADATDGRLLYVGVTRARQNLVLSAAGALTPLMPTAPGLWLEVAP